jgi:hypothetical protein
MQYGIVANYCWLLVEGVYLHNLLSLATFPERSFFALYLGIGWGEWTGWGWGTRLTRATRLQLLPIYRCTPAVCHPLGHGQVSV